MARLSYEMGTGTSSYCVKTRKTTFDFLEIPRFHVYKFVSTIYNAKFELYKKQKDGSWEYVLKYKTDCSLSCCDYSCIELVPEIISGKMTNPVGDYKMEVNCVTCDQNIDSYTFYFTQKIGGVGYYVSDESGDPLKKVKGVVKDPITGNTLESSYSDDYGRILFKTLVDNNSYDFEFSLSGYDTKKEKGKVVVNESLYNISLSTSGTGTLEASTNISSGSYTITGPDGKTYSGSGKTKKVWNNVVTGEYDIAYGSVTGYTTPQSETKTLKNGKTITFYGEYIQNTGTIGVTTNLDDATFDILGPVNYKGSGKSWQVTNAPVGLYTIYWNSVTGYLIPDNDGEQAYLEAGKSIGFIGTYKSNIVIDAEYIINGILRNDYSYISGTTEPNTKLTLYHSTKSTTDPKEGEIVGTTTSDSNGDFEFKVSVGQICPAGPTCPDVVFQYFYVILDIEGVPAVGPYAFAQEEDKTTPGSVCYKDKSKIELFLIDGSGFTDLYILGTGVDPYTCTGAKRSAELSAAGWTLFVFIPIGKVSEYVGKVTVKEVPLLLKKIIRTKFLGKLDEEVIKSYIENIYKPLASKGMDITDDALVVFHTSIMSKLDNDLADYACQSFKRLTTSERNDLIKLVEGIADSAPVASDREFYARQLQVVFEVFDQVELDKISDKSAFYSILRDTMQKFKNADLVGQDTSKYVLEMARELSVVPKEVKPYLKYIGYGMAAGAVGYYIWSCENLAWYYADNMDFAYGAPVREYIKSGQWELAKNALEDYRNYVNNGNELIKKFCIADPHADILYYKANVIGNKNIKEWEKRILNEDPSEIPKKYSPGVIPDVTVTNVSDGDTINFSVPDLGKWTNYPDTLRIAGVNAPEIAHPGLGIEAECYGKEAGDRLKKLLPVGTKIYIKIDISNDDEGHKRWFDEKNNRLVGTIHAEEDVKVGGKVVLKKDQDPMEIMLKEGYVEFYEPYGQGEHPSYDHDSYVAWACEGGETVSACKEILPDHAYRCSPLFMCREFDDPPLYPCCDPKSETCLSCTYGTKQGMWVDCAAGNVGYLKVSEKNSVACYIADYGTETKIGDLPYTLIQSQGIEYTYLIFPDSSVADKYYPEFLSYTIDDVSKCIKTSPCTKVITLKKKPLPPASLTVKNITASSATIDWIEPDSISKYHIVISPNVLDEYITATEYDVDNLAPDTSYNVEVYSIDSAGNVSDAATTAFITDDEKLPKPDKGYLYITSVPSGADLYVDDLKVSGYSTPISGLEYSPGTYGMKLKKDGYNDYDFGFVTISANKNKVLDACLVPTAFTVALKYQSSTSITIIWDELCNVSYFEVYKGSKSFRVTGEKNQYKFDKLHLGNEYYFYIEAYDASDNLLSTSNTLCVMTGYGICKVKEGYLTIKTTPSGADIYIDGSDTGLNTNTKLTFGYRKRCGTVACELGTHDFILKLSGYEDYSFTETINDGDDKTKNITLTPVSGTGTIEAFTNISSGSYTITGPDGKTYSGSGKTKKVWNNVVTGEYDIVYGDVSGYTTPTKQTKQLKKDKTITFYGKYIEISKIGYLSVDSSIENTWVYIEAA